MPLNKGSYIRLVINRDRAIYPVGGRNGAAVVSRNLDGPVEWRIGRDDGDSIVRAIRFEMNEDRHPLALERRGLARDKPKLDLSFDAQRQVEICGDRRQPCTRGDDQVAGLKALSRSLNNDARPIRLPADDFFIELQIGAAAPGDFAKCA